jgi:hypothetical protein
MFLRRAVIFFAFVLLAFVPATAKGPTNLSITLSDHLRGSLLTGTLYVIFADHRDSRDPIAQMRAGLKTQIVAHTINEWNGLAPVKFPSDADAHPAKLNNIKAGSYKVQAFLVCASALNACEADGLLSTASIDKVSLRNGTNIKLMLDHSGPVPDKMELQKIR